MSEPTAWPSATKCKHLRRFAGCPDCGARWDLNELDRLRAAMELAERCHLEQVTQWKDTIDRLRAEATTSDNQILHLSADVNRLRAENERLREAAWAAVHGHDVVISNGGNGWGRHVEEPLWKLRAILTSTAQEDPCQPQD